MSVAHFLGLVIVLFVIVGAGYLSGRNVRSADEFSGNARQGTWIMVLGALIGTLVGGSATVGTAQMAFTAGLSAWWFTLGGALGLLVLGTIYARAVYNSPHATMPSIISSHYGAGAGVAFTLLNTIGSFLTVFSQVIAGVALLTAIFHLNLMINAVIIFVLMMATAIFGGMRGVGIVGVIKTILMAATVLGCGWALLQVDGGLEHILSNPALPKAQYFNVLSRGPAVDLGAGLSLVLGVLTTQTYLSALYSSRSLQSARKGTLIAALIIPLLGLICILVGMYMQLTSPEIVSSLALPLFVLDHFPPIVAGGMIGVLLVAVISTGSGITMGMSNIIMQDLIKRYWLKQVDAKRELRLARLTTFGIILLSCVLVLLRLDNVVLKWGFLSMGLRGAVGFGPLTLALFSKRPYKSVYIISSMVVAVLGVFAGEIFIPKTLDPLFVGLFASIVILVIGWFDKPKHGLTEKGENCDTNHK